MTLVSNDPSWWPFINFDIFQAYWFGLLYLSFGDLSLDLSNIHRFAVAASFVVVYDWVLTLPQEIDLIWTQHWSLMTVLYLVIRYVGIPYSVISILRNIIFYTINGTNVIITAMLGVIMIARLHAMYQGSRRMLIFLVIVFLAVNIACGVIAIIALNSLDKYQRNSYSLVLICYNKFEGDIQLLISMVWMLNTVWEVLALCLSAWIAVKHFRDLWRLGPLTGSTIGDCFRVLIESHVLYFASFASVSCLQLVTISPEVENSNSVAVGILAGTVQILLFVQMFVLGPRLILSVRQYHAKLVAESDAETSMNSIVFQERVHVPTSSTV
ncbi:uncharacterized protein F5147DRAFT_797992 [Suillus discolor]|uniref:DUF6533 domain-containing protein n=1 Tax=Suillus discolor TaxID=1912936 RepID=A0A9P7JUG6_9AGAM|nr:uncharacterized protein F5147DRAFT_797992 [Suillus discolor]KAG2109688.1 hypothetical protein F5147DRAFT_797992 [Suillus discolor]